ncbi:MAG: winged helix-turn-helix transcriptional regulator [Candidatus Thorarchaeota archaeon]
MDSIDKKILWELDADCRITYEKLGQKLGITANAVRKRVEGLIEDGVIVRFMILPHNALISADFISILVMTDGSEEQTDFIQAIGKHPVIHHVSPVVTIEGGAYHLFGQYSSIEMLSDLGQFLRGLETVKAVKQYPVLFPRGDKKELSKLELRVLACLIDNPRMTISELARCSKLTTRKTSRVLKQIQEGGAVRFTVRWDVNAGGNTSFWIIVNWDQKKMSHEKLIQEFEKSFPNEYWTSFVTATEPVIFVRFVVDNLRKVNQITEDVKNMSFVESIQTIVCYSSADFSWLGESLLRDMISNAM